MVHGLVPDPVLGLAAALLSAVVFGVAAVAQAQVVRRSAAASAGLAAFVATAARQPLVWAVVAVYLVGFVLHAVAIWTVPLYLAQAAVSLSLPVTALASSRLSEHLSGPEWWAVGLASVGLALLALGSGSAGPVVPTWPFAAVMWAVVGLLGLASRRADRWAPGTLGAIAGLGYAGSAVAVRGVGVPVTMPVVAAALAVPTLGLVSFWLYSRGLGTGPVTGATAPLVVAQTVVPAVVGVTVLGDGLRDGWWWAVLLGLALATAGAVRLARDGGSEVATRG